MTATRTPIPRRSSGGARPFRWSRKEFVRAADDGAFGERTVELIDGEIYEKMGENHPHRQSTRRAMTALRLAFGAAGVVQAETGLPLGNRSQPKPDLSVLRGTDADYAQREEGPEDVALVVEIVDSRRDTAQQKIKLYGAAGLPEYWILDLRTRTLVVHRDPHAKGYARVETRDETATVCPLERPDAPVAVADLLP